MLKFEDSLLIIVDIQGNLARVMHESEKHNAAALKMINGAKALQLPILLTAQAPDKIGHTIDEVRALLPTEHEYSRIGFSILTSAEIEQTLKERGKKQLILCGYESHICVYQSAMDLMAAGYEVYILTDAVSSRDKQNKKYILKELRAEGAHLINVETALFALMRAADHPAFRTVSKIVK